MRTLVVLSWVCFVKSPDVIDEAISLDTRKWQTFGRWKGRVQSLMTILSEIRRVAIAG